MVTAGQRRQAVRPLQQTFGVSQRRACRVLGQPRSTQRQTAKTSEEEERLVRRMLALVRQHPRWGYRRITVLLRREGWYVNRKRVYRLWRKEGLKVPRKQRKKRRLGHSGNRCVRQPAEHKDHVWTWDFLHDHTSDGRPLKWFTRIDEYTREYLALEVDRGMTAQAVLAGVVQEGGAYISAAIMVRSLLLRPFGRGGGGGVGDVVPCSGCAVGERLRGVVGQQGTG